MDQNEAITHTRELLEEKISSLRQDLYTLRKQVLGNGQPGDLDRMRGVIKDAAGKCDSRNADSWRAIDDLRADRAAKADVYNLTAKIEELEKDLQSKASSADVEDLKKDRWTWAGGLVVAIAAASFIGWLLANFKKVFG